MKNSGATLVRGMREVLSGMSGVESYIDNLIVFSSDWETHLQTLEELLKRLSEANLNARPLQGNMFSNIITINIIDTKCFYIPQKIKNSIKLKRTLRSGCIGWVLKCQPWLLYIKRKYFVSVIFCVCLCLVLLLLIIWIIIL